MRIRLNNILIMLFVTIAVLFGCSDGNVDHEKEVVLTNEELHEKTIDSLFTRLYLFVSLDNNDRYVDSILDVAAKIQTDEHYYTMSVFLDRVVTLTELDSILNIANLDTVKHYDLITGYRNKMKDLSDFETSGFSMMYGDFMFNPYLKSCLFERDWSKE